MIELLNVSWFIGVAMLVLGMALLLWQYRIQ